MKNSGMWKKIPLHRAVLEIVISRSEGISETKLVETLKKEYEIEPTHPELYHTLMKLELQGLIHVESVGREFVIRPSSQALHYFSTRA
ncbi:MAG: ArsR family transcriptional regulator [Desulfurococcaceae archaeon]